MSTKKQLRMTMKMSSGKELTVNLMDPKDGLTKAEVATCLQNVIDKKAIVSGTAYPVSIKEIEVQTVETQALA